MLGDCAPRSAKLEVGRKRRCGKAGNCLMSPIASEMAILQQLSLCTTPEWERPGTKYRCHCDPCAHHAGPKVWKHLVLCFANRSDNAALILRDILAVDDSNVRCPACRSVEIDEGGNGIDEQSPTDE